MKDNYKLTDEIIAQIDAAIEDNTKHNEVTPTKRGPHLFDCIRKEIRYANKEELYAKIELAMKREERVEIRKTPQGARFFRVRRVEVKPDNGLTQE